MNISESIYRRDFTVLTLIFTKLENEELNHISVMLRKIPDYDIEKNTIADSAKVTKVLCENLGLNYNRRDRIPLLTDQFVKQMINYIYTFCDGCRIEKHNAEWMKYKWLHIPLNIHILDSFIKKFE